MKVTGMKLEKLVTIEFKEDEIKFIVGILNKSENDSARNLASVLSGTIESVR